MDRKQIIRMAREAGFCEPNPHDGYMGLAYDYRDGTDTGASLERFAALVAAHEREAIAKSLDKQADLACDEIDRQWAQEMAAAVRARGNT